MDWSVTGRLAGGSIPPTILTLFALYILGIKDNDSPPLITTALGIALVMTAVCVLSHRWLRLLTATQALSEIWRHRFVRRVSVFA